MKLITDKSQIKNGMTFRYDGKLYLKVGKCYIEVIPATRETFDNIEQDKIEAIFKTNGIALIQKEQK